MKLGYELKYVIRFIKCQGYRIIHSHKETLSTICIIRSGAPMNHFGR